MSYLLEILGRGLLSELAAAFRDLLRDDGRLATHELEAHTRSEPENIEWHRRLAVRSLADRQYSLARDRFLEALSIDESDRVSRTGLACAG